MTWLVDEWDWFQSSWLLKCFFMDIDKLPILSSNIFFRHWAGGREVYTQCRNMHLWQMNKNSFIKKFGHRLNSTWIYIKVHKNFVKCNLHFLWFFYHFIKKTKSFLYMDLLHRINNWKDNLWWCDLDVWPVNLDLESS